MKREAGMAGSAILLGLAGLHVFWAAGGRALQSGTIPERDGRPLFQAGPRSTLVVAAGLAAASVAVLSAGTTNHLRKPTLVVAALFALRAMGDFRTVGFFKRRNQSRFAWRDSRIFSPLCGLVSALSLGAAR